MSSNEKIIRCSKSPLFSQEIMIGCFNKGKLYKIEYLNINVKENKIVVKI